MNELYKLTKREIFAAMAMQGFCSDHTLCSMTYCDFARMAVSQADALIEELERTTPQDQEAT